MSDVARKVFPMETVLALVMGKEDVDVRDLAGYLAGRSIACCCCAKIIAPMAAGWLASVYPQFVGLEWDESASWEDFVSQMKSALGDSVSVTPMGARQQAMVGKVLDGAADIQGTVDAQAKEIVAMRARVETLEPFQAKAQELEKKCAQLEAKIKTLTTDAGNLRKQLLPFQGKMAVDQEELETIIKDAIKANMKGLVVGGAVAAAGAAGAEEAAAEPAAEEESGPAPEFGFGSSGANNDGFGF